jgi:hypothetical protein
MKQFLFLVNFFFATPQSLRLLLPTQLLDFVVVFSRRRIIANPRPQSASGAVRDLGIKGCTLGHVPAGRCHFLGGRRRC